MTIFPDDFNILDINPEKDEAEAVALFEKETDKPLFPAQSERIAISVFNYIHNLFKIKVNEAFKNLLLPYAKGIFLDIIGALLGCRRLDASQAVSVVRFKLYELFSFDKIIPKGTEIETSDGEYIFVTDNDVIIPAGELYAEVSVTSVLAGSALNYKKGEITNLIQNYDYIESVENICDAEGGSDNEQDEPYRERLYIAAEKSSTAGPRLAYKYYAMSADKSITDVEVECVQENASILLDGEIYTEKDGVIDNENIHAEIDYKSGIFTVTLKEQNFTFQVKIPPCARIDIYALTENGTPSEEIINKIYDAVNADDRRPLNDLVVVSGAKEQKFDIEAIVYINCDADFDSVQNAVLKALNSYVNDIRLHLSQEILSSDIITLIKNVKGVHDVELKNFKKLLPDKKTYYVGNVSNIQFKRAA